MRHPPPIRRPRSCARSAALALAVACVPAAGRAAPLPPERAAAALGAKCPARADIDVLVSPQRPRRGAALRVLFLSERPLPGAAVVGQGPGGPHALAASSGGGPPHWWLAEVRQAAEGAHRFALVDPQGKPLRCARARATRDARAELGDDVWPVRRSWSRRMENLYAAWIEKLFDAPAGERPSWTPLHLVLRDPARNLLFDHLGAQEDSGPRPVEAKPDCADLPYFVRAYFAWKLQLPFGYRHCDRGDAVRPPHCTELRTNEGKLRAGSGDGAAPARTFSLFLRRHVSYVHSASGRTAPDDEDTDLYPLRLRRDALRPGTVYVDPYGHLLVVSKWVPQRADAGGLLYAVDGHPDLSVGRKRFWKGAFLFRAGTKGGAGGFKAFRPLALRDGKVVPLSNEELRRSRDYRDYSDEQYRMSLEAFYDRMDRVITPRPLSPTQAYRERLTALHELILERVDSVKVGEEHLQKTRYAVVPMPRGPKIFETSGPWEDFSTPARDLRLLIAIEDVLRYPEKVVRQPERFAIPAGQTPAQARQAMERLREQLAAEQRMTYVRSDGRPQQLSTAEVIARRVQLEMAYNPNDCIELRWGATGEELASCKRRAPEEQQQRMRRYRPWFAARTRPER